MYELHIEQNGPGSASEGSVTVREGFGSPNLVADIVAGDNGEALARFVRLANLGLQVERDQMVISFVGEAWEAYQNALDGMKNYGVTITRLDGSEVEAVLLGGGQDDNHDDGATIRYWPVLDGDYLDVPEILREHASEIVTEVVRRVEVS